MRKRALGSIAHREKQISLKDGLRCEGAHVAAIEVVDVSRGSKATGCQRVLRQGGVVHADYYAAAATQMQHCLCRVT